MTQANHEADQPNHEGSGGAPHPAMLARERESRGPVREWCNRIVDAVNNYLRDQCRRKVNRLRHCSDQEEQRCPCTDLEGREGRCLEAPVPELEPCISLSWGDSKCDCMETDDVEVLCITVCNCYSNVTFRNLSIGFLWVTDAAGNPVPTLPNGTPSVEIHPLGPICFGDIGPCRDGRGTCVSREVVLRTRGAQPGDYRIVVGAVCFSVTHDYSVNDCFTLTLCRD